MSALKASGMQTKNLPLNSQPEVSVTTKEIIKLRNVAYKSAKKEVLAYFKKVKEAYPDEAANDLSLPLETVAKITGDLLKEKRLEVIG